jgi:transcription factor TGA
MFDMEYARWVDDHSKLIFQLRGALNDHAPDNQLQVMVGAAMAQHDELLGLKSAIARTDIFHLLCGVWASPAERCFLWLGGFRPSEVIKVCYHVEYTLTFMYHSFIVQKINIRILKKRSQK